MFIIISLNFVLIFQASCTNNLPSFQGDYPPEFSQTIHKDQINDLLVSHYDRRGRLNVCRFSLNRVDDYSANPHDVANIEAHVHLYVRAKATINKGYQCWLSYTTNTKICEFNANTNHYHDRLNYYRKAMLRYHAINRNNCENYVRHLPNSHLSRTVKPKPTAFHTDSDQQVKFKEKFKHLLLIKISMEFGSRAHNSSEKHGYQKLHKINIHCMKHNQKLNVF